MSMRAVFRSTVWLGSVVAIALFLRISPAVAETLEIPGLSAPATLHTDSLGVPHIVAETLADAIRVQGWVHARDRFFQMDLRRRAADGRRAELTGVLGHVFADAVVRSMGLRAAAERDVELLGDPERAGLQAYADGVNAWLATHPLPPEYAELGLTTVPPWTARDPLLMNKLGAFTSDVFLCGALPCDYTDILDLQRYEDAGDAQGFDGRALFLEDHFRIAPIEPAATVPDAGGVPPYVACAAPISEASIEAPGSPATRLRIDLPASEPARRGNRSGGGGGSNAWGVAAAQTDTSSPLLANDPHPVVGAPTSSYPIHLRVTADPVFGAMNLSGTGSAGVPLIAGGQNDHIAWGGTKFFTDNNDAFWDRLLRGDSSCPTRLCIESEGVLHPVEERDEIYFQNDVSDGLPDTRLDRTALVPFLQRQVSSVRFRSYGPIMLAEDPSVLGPGTSPAETMVLTLQYTGLHGSRRARGARGMVTATNVAEFGDAVRDLAPSTGHLVVADTSGGLAYFTGGELPLRADLEAGSVVGLDPRFLRDGSGPSNWIADPARSQGQILPYRVIPPEEMPQIVNPPAGYVVNANNDPSGAELDNDLVNQCRPSSPSSIYYLGASFNHGLRAGRITRLLAAELGGSGSVSVSETQAFQANTQQLDAELMVPFLIDALANAQLPGAAPELVVLAGEAGIVDAVSRLGAWDFSTPTGIPEGYDAADVDGVLDPTVSPQEAAASVAATLYNVWRAELVEAVVVQRLGDLGLSQLFPGASFNHLYHLLTRTPFTGVGASGVDFFPEPAALSSAERRDVALLAAVRATLDRLASDVFVDAFANSTNPDDYRWGRLHRVRLLHPLRGPRSVPPARDYTDLAPGLPGIPRDGGWQTVNASLDIEATLARAPDAFESRHLSGFRRVMSPGHPDAFPDPVLGLDSLPGGVSGDFESPFYMNQLPEWLTVDQHPVVVNAAAVDALPSDDVVAVPVSKRQRSCVTVTNRRGTAVGKTQLREVSSCVAQAAKGNEPDAQACLTADAKGKVAKARGRALLGEERSCEERPVFAYGGAVAASDAGVAAALELTVDLFGTDLTGALIVRSDDKAGATCQAGLLRGGQKALKTIWREVGKAKRVALTGKQGMAPAESGIAVHAALATVFASNEKVERAFGRLDAGGERKCNGVADLPAAAPGVCADGTVATVTSCLRERTLCRACRSVNAMDAMTLPCDTLDNGNLDDSC